ncbi:MAG: Crp/Fnr family transcriptional regulator [Bacteroidetes bacterium]|nr:Crp/Fnr family transcriptional regulator [Bacteroidota bacterium]
MHIDKDLLIAWGARLKKYHKNEIIFSEGEEARCVFQIVEGVVKMYNINDSAGKEFTQGMFGHDNTFGEPAILIDEPYPAHAVCVTDAVIFHLPKDNFLQILKEYPELHFKLTKLMAQRLWDKSMTFKEVMNNTPATRILGFLNSYKKKLKLDHNNRIAIPFTRQEIANFTGLRVETTIRTLNKLNENGKVEIKNRKLFY